jgi:hypothetical protein
MLDPSRLSITRPLAQQVLDQTTAQDGIMRNTVFNTVRNTNLARALQ